MAANPDPGSGSAHSSFMFNVATEGPVESLYIYEELGQQLLCMQAGRGN